MDVDGKGHESDIDELNELLASDGLLDFSAEGRKKAKARAAALKKQNALLAKKEKERERAKKAKPKAPPKDDAQKIEKQLEVEEKKEKRELEARRKKRVRDHEKALKEIERKTKRKKGSGTEKKSNPNEVLNKRGRAETIAKGFLMRKCMKDDSYNGAAFQPTASVEPSGLLGMALAFRAAAGEVPALDGNGKQITDEPWDSIDVDTPMESSKRCKRLQEQLELMEKELAEVDAGTDQRRALIGDAEKARLAAQHSVLEAEDRVRAAYTKKKKPKQTPKKTTEGAGIKADTAKAECNGATSVGKPSVEDKDNGNGAIPSAEAGEAENDGDAAPKKNGDVAPTKDEPAVGTEHKEPNTTQLVDI